MTTISKRIIALIVASAIGATSIAAPVMAQSNTNNQLVAVEKMEKHGKHEDVEKGDMSEAAEKAETAKNIANNPQIVKSLESQGYSIHDLEKEHGHWQAEVTDKSGNKLELILDDQGTIISQDND